LNKSLFVISLLPILFAGCIATSREVADLKADIYQLRRQLNELQKNQADLSGNMDSLNTNLGVLNENLEDNKSRMSLLAQRMDDIHSALTQRMDLLSKQMSGATPSLTPLPSELYRLAYSDYSKGKYDLAIIGLRSYLEKYPLGELAPNAQYYIADCYFNKQNWDVALSELNKFSEQHQKNELTPSALYKKTLCLIELKKTEEAKTILQSIIKDYPQTPEAEQSKDKLLSITGSNVEQ